MFVTKLAAMMLRSGFQELPKMPSRSFQNAPKRCQDEPKIAPRGIKINTRSKEVGHKVFVTKLAAKMLRSAFQELPKMPPRSCQDTPKRFQDEPKIVPRGSQTEPRSPPETPR